MPDPDNSTGGEEPPVYYYGYDVIGNLKWETDPLGEAPDPVTGDPNDTHTTFYDYDNLNRLVTMTLPDPDGTVGLGNSPQYHYGYDAVGNLIWETDPLGSAPNNGAPDEEHTTFYRYDNLYRKTHVIDALCQAPYADDPQNAFINEYDLVGNVISTTDQEGNKSEFSYDQLGRLQVKTDSLGNKWLFVYDANDNIIKALDPLSRTTEYAYDKLNRLVKEILPNLNPDDQGENSPVYYYGYDAVGNLIWETDPLGDAPAGSAPDIYHTTFYEYDDLNRLIQKTLPDPDDSSGGEDPPVYYYGYDANGNLKYVTNPSTNGSPMSERKDINSTTWYFYDALNRQTHVINAAGPDPDNQLILPEGWEGFTTHTSYDAVGNISSIADELGRVTSYHYDELNRLVKETLPDPDNNPATDNQPVYHYGYDAAGNLKWETDPLGVGPDSETGEPENGSVVTEHTTYYDYDHIYRLIQKTLPDPDGLAGPAESPIYYYHYDSTGNLVWEVDPLGTDPGSGTPENGEAKFYQYDKLGRLTAEISPDPDGPIAGSLPAPVTSYTYDGAGRLLTVTDTVGNITSYEYDNLDRKIRETLPDPDGKGSQVAPTTTYVYDIKGNLLLITDVRANSGEYSQNDKLVAHWKLDGDTDNAFEGEASLTVTTGNEWEVGQYGQSLSFDSVDDNVDITNLDVNTSTGEYNTVSFWMKWDGTNYQIPFSWGGSSNHCAYCLLFKNNFSGTPYFGFNTGNSGDILGVPSDGLEDRWVHVVAVFCNENPGESTLYIDGQEMDLQQSGSQNETRKVNNSARLSGWYGSGDLHFSGLIDDLRIYKGELTASEVVAESVLLGTTRYGYDSLGRMVQEIGSPVANSDGTFDMPSVEYYYDASGNIISTEDDLGCVTLYEYDNLGQLIKTTLPDPDGAEGPAESSIYYYGYDAMGNLKWETDPLGTAPDTETGEPENGNAVTEHTIFYEYDNLDRLTKVTQPDPDGNIGTDDQPIYHYGYDAAGNLLWETGPLGQAPDPSGDPDAEYTTFYEYDDLHRLIKTTQPDPDYDGKGSNQPIYHYGYDALGNLLWETDPLGAAPTAGIPDETHTTFYTYDRLGRLNNAVSPDPDGTNIDTLPAPLTSYLYDALGNLCMELDTVGNVTSYEYDNLGRLISETLPDPDLESYRDGPQPAAKTTYTYDASGNLLSVTDAKANAGEYGPDAFSDDKLVAYWKFDGDLDLDVYIESNPPVAISDRADWEDGRFGEALSFDAAESVDHDHVDITNLDVNESTGEYNTVSFWMKWDGGNYQMPFSWGGSSNHCAYCLLFKNNHLGFCTGNGEVLGISSLGLNDRWVHVVAAFCNINTSASKLYIDGQQMDLTLVAPPDHEPLERSVNNSARLSGWNGSGDFPFGGLLDDLRIYKGELTDPEVAALLGTTRYEYDSLGRMVKEIGSPIDNGDSTFCYPAIIYEYDTAGNVTSVTDELEHVTVYAYDKLNRLVQTTLPDPDGSELEYESPVYYYCYDKAGNLLWETGPLGSAPDPVTGAPENGSANTDHTTYYRYDALHRQIQVLDALTDNDPENPTHATITAYDKAGNITSVTDAEENTTGYQYDRINRLVVETDPLEATRQYEYDRAGRLIKQTDRNNRTITFDYDATHRLTEERWYDVGHVPGTNDPINIITTEYDELGQTTEIFDSAASYEYSYDHAGRVTHAMTTLSASTETYAFDYRYDSLGNVTQIIDSFGGQTDYAYNAMGMLDWVSQSGINVTGKSVEFEYKDNGQLETVTRRNNHLVGGAAAAVSSYVYDQLDRLDALTHDNGSSNLLAEYDFHHDIDSRIDILDINYPTDTYDFHNIYEYDNIDQLKKANDGTSDVETYSYNYNGNRNTADGVSYSHNTDYTNQLECDGTYCYTYDGEGNRTEKFIWNDRPLEGIAGVIEDVEKTEITEYRWDNRNRLIKVIERPHVGTAPTKVIDYIYDALDNRTVTLVDSDADGSYTDADDERTYSLFQGSDLFLELSSSNNLDNGATVARRYLYGQSIDDLIAVEDYRCDEIFWTLSDHQGSVRDAVYYDDATQTTTHILHREFDSFGTFSSVYPDSGFDADTVTIPQAFTGRLYDENTGLYDYRARWFDPTTGNFISEDPISFSSGDANLYRYCGNSPTNYTDPSGNSWVSHWWNEASGTFSHWFDEGTDALINWYKETEDAVDHWSDEVRESYLHLAREIEEENKNFWHNPSKYLADNWKDGDLLLAAGAIVTIWTYGPMLSQFISNFTLPNGSFVLDMFDDILKEPGTWQFQPASNTASMMSTTTASTNSVIQTSYSATTASAVGSGNALAAANNVSTAFVDMAFSTSAKSLSAVASPFASLSLDTLAGGLGGINLNFSIGLNGIGGLTSAAVLAGGVGWAICDSIHNRDDGQAHENQENHDTQAPAAQSPASPNEPDADSGNAEPPETDQQTAKFFYDDILSYSPQLAQSRNNVTKTKIAYENAWFWQSSSRKGQYDEAVHSLNVWKSRVEELRQRMAQSPGVAQKTIEALSLDMGRKDTVSASDIIASSTKFQNFMLEYQKPIQASIKARNLRGPVGGWESEGMAMLQGGVRGLGTGGKAVVNGLAQAGASTISLGYWQVDGPLAVTDWDRAMGYDTSAFLARASGEILIGAASGGMASGLSKAGIYGRYTSYAVRGFDAAGNVTEFGRGIGNASVNGLTLQNSLQMAGAGLGTLGDFADLLPTGKGLGGIASSNDGLWMRHGQELSTKWHNVRPRMNRLIHGSRNNPLVFDDFSDSLVVGQWHHGVISQRHLNAVSGLADHISPRLGNAIRRFGHGNVKLLSPSQHSIADAFAHTPGFSVPRYARGITIGIGKGAFCFSAGSPYRTWVGLTPSQRAWGSVVIAGTGYGSYQFGHFLGESIFGEE